MTLASGTKLGPYEIVEPIGAGGMGEVYRARDPRLNRDVAIKVSGSQFSERFEREVKAIAALNHPNICQIYDVGPDYLVMELIEGSPLRGPLPLDRVLRYSVQICGALDAAHKKNITHRDLKPSNILVTESGVKLLDFGLAKIGNAVVPATHNATTQTDITQAGAVLGTAAYMSPEQAKGEETDARSDIFSLGLVLYEMLTGRPAFSMNSPIETMAAILRDEPAPLDASPKLRAIVSRCLRKSPASRFQTMNEVRAALEQLTDVRTVDLPSIAVLPFANMSPDAEDEYFSDGLAEEIINALAQVHGLKVIARTSAFAFKRKNEDIRKIAEALGVRNVLEGSVRRSGNRLRVTAQLIDASDGVNLWSQRYDRNMTDVFAIQDEISRSISEALQVRLAPPAKTVSLEAYQHYLKGQYYRARPTPESLAKAKDSFEQALAIDSNYAPAYSGLAAYYYLLAAVGITPTGEAAPLAKSAAENALAIDPDNSEAYSVLAVMAAFDYDWKLVEMHFQKAMSVGPVPSMARFRYAQYYLIPMGRSADALHQSRLALDTDPLSMPVHFGMAWAMCCAKQYDEAIEYARRALEIDPNFYLLWLTLGFAQLDAGLPRDAIPSLERVVELAPWYNIGIGSLAAAYHQAGDDERGHEWARKVAETHAHTVGAAFYYAAVGDVEKMFEALEAAFRRGSLDLRNIKNWRTLPFFDPYRSHPRFQGLLAKMNLL